MSKIAFIGLGNMGEPMAINLIKSGHKLKVFDLAAEPLKRTEKLGATIAKTAGECVEDAEFVISMLPAGKHVEGLYLGETNLLEKVSKDCIVIDCSTIDVATTKKLSQEANKRNINIIDAPVSGGVGGAKAGTLSFMVGGTKQNFEVIKSLLSCMGKNIFHAGESGAGQMAKACNNMLLGILMVGTSETLQLGIANGLDPKILSEIMLNSSGRNWTLEVYNPSPNILENVPSSNNYEGGFALDLMLKDMNLAMQASSESKSATPLGSLSRCLYAQYSNMGNGHKDFSSIYDYFSTK
ncbi:3-hydroxyisobutyrate dehydrogenase [Arcobacter sp.]|uniref:3-hydroxyisobutyrate dehydrogenase n=1 Tax=Arcobacter sp. TaxID=1872629 RepID=UPI003C779C3B